MLVPVGASLGASLGRVSFSFQPHLSHGFSYQCTGSSSPAETFPSLNTIRTDPMAPQTGGLSKPVTHLSLVPQLPSSLSHHEKPPSSIQSPQLPRPLAQSPTPMQRPRPQPFDALPLPPASLGTRELPSGKCNACLTLFHTCPLPTGSDPSLAF